MSEQSLLSDLSKKCEIIASLEKNTVNCDQLKEQHVQEMQRLSSEHEQNMKEVIETLKTNQLEEKRQLVSQHESECMQMSNHFETENANLNALLMKKSEELEEFFKKTNIATEDIKESFKLANEKALQDQKAWFQENIDQVIYKPIRKNFKTLFFVYF